MKAIHIHASQYQFDFNTSIDFGSCKCIIIEISKHDVWNLVLLTRLYGQFDRLIQDCSDPIPTTVLYQAIEL